MISGVPLVWRVCSIAVGAANTAAFWGRFGYAQNLAVVDQNWVIMRSDLAALPNAINQP